MKTISPQIQICISITNKMRTTFNIEFALILPGFSSTISSPNRQALVQMIKKLSIWARKTATAPICPIHNFSNGTFSIQTHKLKIFQKWYFIFPLEPNYFQFCRFDWQSRNFFSHQILHLWSKECISMENIIVVLP